MSSIQREQLIECLVDIRLAERDTCTDQRIRKVRARLERLAGSTVVRSVASRLLGVSQTALDRWISRGDIPAVITPGGRTEVPLPALVELIGAVRCRVAARGVGGRPLAAELRERRALADHLDTGAATPAAPQAQSTQHGHAHAERLGLAYHRALAPRLNEQIVEDARERLRRWQEEGGIAHGNAELWEAVLAQPPATIAALISADEPRARRLRQSSPFAGALSEPERQRLLAALSSS